jgi:RecA-family ATPase
VITGDENSTKDMNELSKCLSKIAANTQSAIVIVHHEAKASAGRKKGTSRGSGALLADVRSEIRVHDTNNQKTLEHTKSNNSEKRKAVKYNLVNKELGLDKYGRRIKAGVFVPEKTLDEQIQDFNSSNYQYTRKQFEDYWGLQKSATLDRLEKLRQSGKVTLIGQQYHTSTPLNEL